MSARPLRTLDEKKAYGRGYAAGKYRSWPAHRPPEPPNELVAELSKAAMELRDAVDATIAALDPDDDWVKLLGEPLDKVDIAHAKITAWLLECDEKAVSE